MAKFIIVLFALVACAVAKPGVLAPVAAPLAYSAPLTAAPLAYSAPLATAPVAYSAPLAYPAPLAYSGAIVAPGGSSRVDIQNNYNAALFSAPYGYAPQAVAAYTAAPFAARIAAPYAYAPQAIAASRIVAAPAAYAASYGYSTPIAAAAPLKYTSAPPFL